MTAATTELTEHVSEASEDHIEHHDGVYWRVFFALFVITGLEVSTYWWPHKWHKVTFVLLLVMMAIKFGTVALYFMHLKYDHKILKRVFFFGLTLAVVVYLLGLGALNFFQDSGTDHYNYPPRDKPLPPPATDPPPIIKEIHHG